MTAGTLEIAPNELDPGSDTALTDTLAEATRFLKALDPEPDAAWTFQTFGDTDNKDPRLARVLHGDLEDHIDELLELNRYGAGVFVCMNETDGKGRTAQNILHVRAAAVDLDGPSPNDVLNMNPHIVVETSPDRWHGYWRLHECPLDEFSSIQRALAKRFGGDPTVIDLPRVMRLPGFKHWKNPQQPFLSRIHSINSKPPYERMDLIRHLGLEVEGAQPAPQRFELPTQISEGSRNNALFAYGRSLKVRGVTQEEIAAALAEANQQRCVTPLLDDEITKIVDNVWAQPNRHDFAAPVAATHLVAPPSGLTTSSTAATGSQSQADKVIEALGDIELFNDGADGEYASFYVNGHLETHRLSSQRFARHCQGRYYNAYKSAVGEQPLKSAIDLCKAKALFEGETRLVGMRVVESGGKIWLDLCNDAWQVVEVDASGWQIKAAEEIDVRFWRPRYAHALPNPVHGAKLSEFASLFNTDAAGWALIQAALLGILRPDIPQPILALYGQMGSGKSFAGSMVRRIIDPNESDLRAEPHDLRDLAASLQNNFVVGIDNVSYLGSQISDALCRVTTGAGFAARELYTNSEERLVKARRPVILTAIEEVITRGDLMDRAFIVRLRSIAKEERKTEDELQEVFSSARPRLLGALLDAAVTAFKTLPEVRKKKLDLPRLADLAQWATAAESALDLPDGKTFLEVFEVEHARASASVTEADVITEPLRRLANAELKWTGYPAALLAELTSRASFETTGQRNWPKSPRALTGRLERLAPNLSEVGIAISFDQPDRNNRRRIELRRIVDGAAADSSGKTSAISASSAGPMAPGNQSASQDGRPVVRVRLQQYGITTRARADNADVADVVPGHSPFAFALGPKTGGKMTFGDADGYYLLPEDNLGRRGSETSEPTATMDIPDFSQELF